MMIMTINNDRKKRKLRKKMSMDGGKGRAEVLNDR